MEEFSVLMKITHVTQSPYLSTGRMKLVTTFHEKDETHVLTAFILVIVFWVCLFRTEDICLVNFLWAITFILSFAWRMFCCQVWSNSISALSQNGVFSLLSVIGCRTKSYDSNKNWGCHRHPACHLCWPKTPGASSESSRGRGGLEVDASKLICTHYKQQGG